MRDSFEYDPAGHLTITPEQITEHSHEGRTIPSGLFGHAEAAELSGVLFSNSHTVSIFNRIGTEQGLGAPDVVLYRFGTCYDPDPDASKSQAFAYVVGDRPADHQETFSEGLHLFLNPYARVPLTSDALPGITFHELQPDGQVMANIPTDSLQAFVSKTMVFDGPGAYFVARYQQLTYLGFGPEKASPKE